MDDREYIQMKIREAESRCAMARGAFVRRACNRIYQGCRWIYDNWEFPATTVVVFFILAVLFSTYGR